MPIVGFNFTNIQAKKEGLINKDIRILSNCAIIKLTEERLPAIDKKTQSLRFEFKFDLKYEPKIGAISLEGYIIYMDDPKMLKTIITEWKKKKTLPQNIMQLIINAILVRSTVKALTLGQELNLPPHIPLPIISPKSNPKDYIG